MEGLTGSMKLNVSISILRCAFIFEREGSWLVCSVRGVVC